MAADSATWVSKYMRAIEAFNNDDVQTFGELFAEQCTFEATAGQVGTTRQEIVEALQAGRAAGWLTHNPIGTVAAGEFLVAVFENRYADGSSVISAGCMRFGDDGRVSEVRTLESR